MDVEKSNRFYQFLQALPENLIDETKATSFKNLNLADFKTQNFVYA
jgi:hypothetical protein